MGLEWAPMRRTFLLVAVLLACSLSTAAPEKHSYLFAWCGDIESKVSDFLTVVDANPASPQYGKVLESLPTGGSPLGLRRGTELQVLEEDSSATLRPSSALSDK